MKRSLLCLFLGSLLVLLTACVKSDSPKPESGAPETPATEAAPTAAAPSAEEEGAGLSAEQRAALMKSISGKTTEAPKELPAIVVKAMTLPAE